MKIEELVKGIPGLTIKGAKDISIRGVCADSRKVTLGDLFIAKKGGSSDGAHFITEAIKNGATCIVTSVYDPSREGVTQLIHPDVGAIEAILASSYYQRPSKKLFCVGVTGTNGKTTTSYLIKHLLDSLGKPTGLMGTVETIIKEIKNPSSLTTSDSSSNQRSLREMVDLGCKGAVLETSSHGLDQGRVEGIDFDAAIFTNLTPEHLDYHKTMQEYAKAKKILFSYLEKSEKKEKIAILNGDSPWSEKLIEGLSIPTLFYGKGDKVQVKASEIVYKVGHTEFTVQFEEKKIPFSIPLLGEYNVFNVLAACSLGLHLKSSLEELSTIFSQFPQVPGRMQRIFSSAPFSLFVDFAHTEDALAQTLQTFRKVAKKRILTVFGCGGNRDKTKREKMGAVSESFSDLTILTNDNPRKEEPEEIVDQIIQGFKGKSYLVELDREKAIEKAISLAEKDDIIVIAGRGHEPFQIIGEEKIPFQDARVAANLLKQSYP